MDIEKLVEQVLLIKDTPAIRAHLDMVVKLVTNAEQCVRPDENSSGYGGRPPRRTNNMSVHQRKLFFGERSLGPLRVDDVSILGTSYNCISFFDATNLRNFCLTRQADWRKMLPLANTKDAAFKEIRDTYLPALIEESASAARFSTQGIKPLPKSIHMRGTPQFGRIPISPDGRALLEQPFYPIVKEKPSLWLPCIPWQRIFTVGKITRNALSWFYYTKPHLLAVGNREIIISCEVHDE